MEITEKGSKIIERTENMTAYMHDMLVDVVNDNIKLINRGGFSEIESVFIMINAVSQAYEKLVDEFNNKYDLSTDEFIKILGESVIMSEDEYKQLKEELDLDN